MPITVNATSATFLMALAFVAGLTWLSRREAHPLWLIAIVAVPIGLLHLDTDWRLFSVHGLMHASMVYEIFERGLPAETPLVAGTPLQYPYGVHVLVAGILRVMPISPPTVFAMLNISCLIGSIVVFDRIARGGIPRPRLSLARPHIGDVWRNRIFRRPVRKSYIQFGFGRA